MKFEFSAGGVVYKKLKTENEKHKNKEDILILLCQHAQHHGWVFPKGLIGDTIQGEKKEATALREVEEETGVVATLGAPLTPVVYWYQFNEEKRKKTVYYYLMEYISENPTKKDDEMEQVAWIPYDGVAEKLTYPSDKKVWKEAKQFIVHSS
jgi:8-oxo-dGTP pyrophosphatase MutT (NUDIX family)